MKVFLTGATGYVGGAIAAELLEAGHSVVALARSPAKTDEARELGAESVVGDLASPAAWADTAAACDAVVHAALEYGTDGDERAEVDRAAVDAFLTAAWGDGAVRQLVYTSSVFLLGATAVAEPLTEASPAPRDHSWRLDHERRILAAARPGLATAVIRLGYVYGGKGGTIRDALAPSTDGTVAYPGAGANRLSFVHVRDAARLYRLVLEKRGRGIFHAVDGAPLAVADAAFAVSRSTGNGRTTRVPEAMAAERFGGFARILLLDVPAEAPRSRTLGWSPAHASFAESAAEAFGERDAGR